jgi:hypothetical protein
MQYRTIDGSSNNISNPMLDSAGTDFARIGPAHFADGISRSSTARTRGRSATPSSPAVETR